MKVLVVGGGPGGLSFATLLARSDPSHRITVLERNPPDQDPGWGITLRTNMLSFLDLDKKCPLQTLTGRACWYRGELVVDLPYPPTIGNTGVPRAAVLRALATSCAEAGVDLRFGVDGRLLREADLEGYDLVVAADGAHSAIRQMYVDSFRPTMTPGRNRYSWLAVEKPFHKLTILLEDGDVPMLAWAYKHTSAVSTLVVEISEETLAGSGMLKRAPLDACAQIGRVFERELEGAAVLSQGAPRWQTFYNISCERLRHRHIVLIGDAAHTTHFSQGYGTMFAFEDALALSRALAGASDVNDALEQYEKAQRSQIGKLQANASTSMRWAESIVEAADRRDEARLRALIAARWPNNEIPPAPMSSYGDTPISSNKYEPG